MKTQMPAASGLLKYTAPAFLLVNYMKKKWAFPKFKQINTACVAPSLGSPLCQEEQVRWSRVPQLRPLLASPTVASQLLLIDQPPNLTSGECQGTHVLTVAGLDQGPSFIGDQCTWKSWRAVTGPWRKGKGQLVGFGDTSLNVQRRATRCSDAQPIINFLKHSTQMTTYLREGVQRRLLPFRSSPRPLARPAGTLHLDMALFSSLMSCPSLLAIYIPGTPQNTRCSQVLAYAALLGLKGLPVLRTLPHPLCPKTIA